MQSLKSSSSLIFLPKLNIHITDHMIGKIITNIEGLEFAELRKLFEDVLVEIFEVGLERFW